MKFQEQKIFKFIIKLIKNNHNDLIDSKKRSFFGTYF